MGNSREQHKTVRTWYSNGLLVIKPIEKLPIFIDKDDDYYVDVNILIDNGTIYFEGKMVKVKNFELITFLAKHFNVKDAYSKKEMKKIGIKCSSWNDNAYVSFGMAESFKSHYPEIRFNWEDRKLSNMYTELPKGQEDCYLFTWNSHYFSNRACKIIGYTNKTIKTSHYRIIQIHEDENEN